jgi:hypothetical protein
MSEWTTVSHKVTQRVYKPDPSSSSGSQQWLVGEERSVERTANAETVTLRRVLGGASATVVRSRVDGQERAPQELLQSSQHRTVDEFEQRWAAVAGAELKPLPAQQQQQQNRQLQ